AEDGIRDGHVTGVQTCALPILVVTGYFGDRLAQMCERYGATVTRLNVEWGRACDPDAVRRQLNSNGADVVAMVHAETSTGVVNRSEERRVGKEGRDRWTPGR